MRQIKIFRASGAAEIARLESQVNGWLEETFGRGSGKVNSIVPAMCSVGDPNEMYQYLVITIDYND